MAAGAPGWPLLTERLELRPQREDDLEAFRVLERLGMGLEATLVENEWVKGEWQSELQYAILRREWAR